MKAEGGALGLVRVVHAGVGLDLAGEVAVGHLAQEVLAGKVALAVVVLQKGHVVEVELAQLYAVIATG